jgi:hypothetical protein
MQNKGVITFFAVLLALVCVFYLSFTFATNGYYKKAKEYSGGDQAKESHFLDSLATEKNMAGIYPEEKPYNGVKFRSRLERRNECNYGTQCC